MKIAFKKFKIEEVPLGWSSWVRVLRERTSALGADGRGARGAGARIYMHHEDEHAPSVPPIDPPVPPLPAITTDESVPPAHPAPESGSIFRWVNEEEEDPLEYERLGVMCNKNRGHWILCVATNLNNLTRDPPEKCVISTLDSLNGDNAREACVFREFLQRYIQHRTGRTIADDLFIIHKVIVPENCMQRDGVNCGIYLGVYLTNLFDRNRSIQESVEDSTPKKIRATRERFFEFLCRRHQNNINTGRYHSEYYNAGRNFVPHNEIPDDDGCIILSASDLHGRDKVNIGLKELARVNPRYKDWLNDTIVQYFYFNKLNLTNNRTNRVFRCFSTFLITRMMRQYQIDPSQCGYTTATAASFTNKKQKEKQQKRSNGDSDDKEEEAKRFCIDRVVQNGFGHLL